MQLAFINEAKTTIRATLEDGETLGNLVGPKVAFVPTDPDNSDYAAIVSAGLPIAPFTRQSA